MPTFHISVLKHQQRQTDQKYPVSIRLTHLRKSVYISTGRYVSVKQLDSDLNIKDNTFLAQLYNLINKWDELISTNLGLASGYTAKELVDFIRKQEEREKNQEVGFVEFMRNHIARLRQQGANSYAESFETTLRTLTDFCMGREDVLFSEITLTFLTDFEAYLRTPRTLRRLNQFGRPVIIERGPVSDATIVHYMTNIRTCFNEAIKLYNDEDAGIVVIKNYPFRKYRFKKAVPPESRSLSLNEVRKIFHCTLPPSKRAMNFARDIFILSFGLLGMNIADLYEANHYKAGRITYKRKKTRSRRSDEALISVKVEPEVLPVLEKYLDPEGKRVFRFYKKYRDRKTFVANVNKGLKQLAAALGLPDADNLSSYYARHSWATLAYNECGISKDVIQQGLNQVNRTMRITDIYIAKRWDLIDSANRQVLDRIYQYIIVYSYPADYILPRGGRSFYTAPLSLPVVLLRWMPDVSLLP